MDCTGGRKSCPGEKSAVLDLAAISLSVAYFSGKPSDGP
jgi:hypothetical protein